MNAARDERLVVSGRALLPVAQAARLLGFRGARRWILDHVPLRLLAGRERVLWDDVVAATDGPAAKPKRKPLRLADL